MEIGAVLLVLTVAVAAGWFLAMPFQGNARRGEQGELRDVSALLAERERMIIALQELDFDHALGKIPAEDYPAQRAELIQRGAEIMRKLDAASPSPSGTIALEAERSGGEINAITNPMSPDDDPLEALIAARRSARKNKSGGFCPRCGKPVLATDRFCPNCGKAIN